MQINAQEISNIKEALHELGYQIKAETATHYRMRPLYRDSDNDTVLGVNKYTGAFRDFKTGQSGNFETLIKLTGGDISVDIQKQQPDSEKIEIDEKFNPNILKTFFKSYAFYQNKGISKDTLEFFRGGLCTAGRLYRRFVFPIYDSNGDICGLSGRDVTDRNKIKWKHLGRSSKWCYPYFLNRDFIKDEVILVESIGDMLSLWEAGYKNSLVLFGCKLHNEVLKTILSINPNRVIIATNKDNNMAGQKSSVEIKNKLDKWLTSSKVVIKIPEHKNDFGCMTSEEIHQWYNS